MAEGWRFPLTCIVDFPALFPSFMPLLLLVLIDYQGSIYLLPTQISEVGCASGWLQTCLRSSNASSRSLLYLRPCSRKPPVLVKPSTRIRAQHMISQPSHKKISQTFSLFKGLIVPLRQFEISFPRVRSPYNSSIGPRLGNWSTIVFGEGQSVPPSLTRFEQLSGHPSLTTDSTFCPDFKGSPCYTHMTHLPCVISVTTGYNRLCEAYGQGIQTPTKHPLKVLTPGVISSPRTHTNVRVRTRQWMCLCVCVSVSAPI